MKPSRSIIAARNFGHYFENVVGLRFIEAGRDVLYWEKVKSELDFIVLGPGSERLAIEVRSCLT